MSCFRHLEKPIKTKEHKIKHFCFYMFLLVLSCFFRRRQQIFKRRAAKPQSLSFLRTRNARKKRYFRSICVFRVHVYINHRYSGSHRCKSRAQARLSLKSVFVFKKNSLRLCVSAFSYLHAAFHP